MKFNGILIIKSYIHFVNVARIPYKPDCTCFSKKKKKEKKGEDMQRKIQFLIITV